MWKNNHKLRRVLQERGIKSVRQFNEFMASTGLTPIGRDRISRYMNGKQSLYTDSIIRLCHILDCTPNDIIEFEREADKQTKAPDRND